MEFRNVTLIISVTLALLFFTSTAFAENIDPYDDGSQYAYGENIGWVNFEPNLCVTGVL